MENLIKKLQEEAGISEDQAIKAVSAMKKFMDEEGIDIDWGKFFKGKYEEYGEKAKDLYEKLSVKADDLVDKAGDFVEKAKDEVSKLFDKDKK